MKIMDKKCDYVLENKDNFFAHEIKIKSFMRFIHLCQILKQDIQKKIKV